MRRLSAILFSLPLLAFGAERTVMFNDATLRIVPTNFFRSNIVAGANLRVTYDSQGRPTLGALQTVADLTNAINNATNGETIPLAAGLFNFTNGQALILTNRVRLIGSGNGTNGTVINYSGPAATKAVLFRDQSYLANLTILCTNNAAGVVNGPMGFTSGVSATNVLVENVEAYGGTDAGPLHVENGHSIKLVNCTFNSAWDGTFQSGGLVESHGCRYYCYARANVNDSQQVNGIFLSGGTNRLFDCIVDVRDGRSITRGAVVTAGRLEAYRTAFRAKSIYPSQLFAITNENGVVVLSECQLDGPVGLKPTDTWTTRLPSIEGSFGREIRGFTSASGRYTNTANDRFIAFDVSAAAGTNTLPDIGFRTLVSVTITQQPSVGNTFIWGNMQQAVTNTFIFTNNTPVTRMVEIGATPADTLLNLYFALSGDANGTRYDDSLTEAPTATNYIFFSYPQEVLTGTATPASEPKWHVISVTTNDAPTFEGTMITVTDFSGSAATRNITVVPYPNRQARINGATSYTVNANYGSPTFMAFRTNWVRISQ